MSTPRNYGRAASFALSGFSLWTVSDTLTKLGRSEGIPQGEVLLIAGLGGTAVIFFYALAQRKLGKLQPKRWGGLLALGLCQLAAALFWVTALPSLPLANMYIVGFLTPMAVAFIAALLFKEHLGWKRALTIIAGFLGVVIAVNPAALMQNDAKLTPYLFAFGTMVGTAAQMLILREVAHKETPESACFYPRLTMAAGGMLACVFTGFSGMSAWTFFSLFAAGALGGIGWSMMSQAYKNAPAASVAPFQYSQMITAALLGYLIWGDRPDRYLIAGTFVIVAAGISLIQHERRLSRTLNRMS